MNLADRDSYFKFVRPPEPIECLKVGDLVGFAAYHVFQIGLGPTSAAASAVGRVIEHHPNGTWVRVAFGEEDVRWVARQHLARPGANRRWCAVD